MGAITCPPCCTCGSTAVPFRHEVKVFGKEHLLDALCHTQIGRERFFEWSESEQPLVRTRAEISFFCRTATKINFQPLGHDRRAFALEEWMKARGSWPRFLESIDTSLKLIKMKEDLGDMLTAADGDILDAQIALLTDIEKRKSKWKKGEPEVPVAHIKTQFRMQCESKIVAQEYDRRIEEAKNRFNNSHVVVRVYSLDNCKSRAHGGFDIEGRIVSLQGNRIVYEIGSREGARDYHAQSVRADDINYPDIDPYGGLRCPNIEENTRPRVEKYYAVDS